MAPIIKKVALAGASGNLGPAILDQLLKHAFDVTVLTRQTSAQHVFPPSIKVARVDYASVDSLTSALCGQDAVVSALPTLTLGPHLLLVDAAATAGVRRFIPSEFGSDTTNAKTAALPIYKNKVLVQKALREKAAAGGGMSYTAICTGPFLDWGLTRGFMSIEDKRVTLWDGGDGLFSTSTLATIGKAVCGVLAHPEETENRVVRVHDAATTQNRLLAMAQKAVGPDGWTVENRSTAEALAGAWDAVGKGRSDFRAMFGFIPAAAWGEGYGGYFEKTDNELLGLREMSEDEVQTVVDECAKL